MAHGEAGRRRVDKEVRCRVRDEKRDRVQGLASTPGRLEIAKRGRPTLFLGDRQARNEREERAERRREKRKKEEDTMR